MATIKSKDRPASEWTPPEPPGPQFGFGRAQPFAPRPDDDLPDVIVVGGIRLVRAPDGSLVGIDDRKPPEAIPEPGS